MNDKKQNKLYFFIGIKICILVVEIAVAKTGHCLSEKDFCPKENLKIVKKACFIKDIHKKI